MDELDHRVVSTEDSVKPETAPSHTSIEIAVRTLDSQCIKLQYITPPDTSSLGLWQRPLDE